MGKEQEELDRKMRAWRMELFALGTRCPLVSGSPSKGLLAIFETVTGTMREHEVVDFKLLVDYICRLEEDHLGSMH
jgi:hypothetical protein